MAFVVTNNQQLSFWKGQPVSAMKKQLGPARPFDFLFFGIPSDSAKPEVVSPATPSDDYFLEVSGEPNVIGGKNVVKSPPTKPGPKPGKKRGAPKRREEKEKTPEKVFSADDVGLIQWEVLKKPHYSSLNCRYALRLVEVRRLALDRSSSPSLYRDFVSRLELLFIRKRVIGGM